MRHLDEVTLCGVMMKIYNLLTLLTVSLNYLILVDVCLEVKEYQGWLNRVD